MRRRTIPLGFLFFLFTFFRASDAQAVNYSVGVFGHYPVPMYPQTISDYYALSASGGLEGALILDSRTSFTLEVFVQPLFFKSYSGDSWIWGTYELHEGTTFGSADAIFFALEVNLRQRYTVSGNLQVYWQCGFGYYFMYYDTIDLMPAHIKDPEKIKIRVDEKSPACQFGGGLDYAFFNRFALFVEIEAHYIFTNIYPTAVFTAQTGLRVLLF